MRLFVCVCAALIVFSGPDQAVATAEIHLADGSELSASTPAPAPRRMPVLFVHGHAFDILGNTTDDPQDPNYKKNFWDRHNGLPSFLLTLEENSGLEIEPYFIRFADQARSITEDARDIEDAVDRIIQRHNPGFSIVAPAAPPPVQLAIIAYSKGAISTRQYLKSLQIQVQDPAPAPGQPRPPGLLAPRPNYRPVSEFIAISPPNHGVAFPLSRNTTLLSIQQLHDGVKSARPFGGGGCGDSYNAPQAADFISTLNGHPTMDTFSSVSDLYPSEAPGSRRDGFRPRAGTLYVTLYADANADAVGGDGVSGDCVGRKVARNLAADASGPIAINIPLAGIPGGSNDLTVHANTVHFREVICKALFAAVHHRSPAGEPACPTVVTADGDTVPVIRLPEQATVMLALDISGSMSLPACPGCTTTRLDVLKDSVELFTQLWLMMGRTDDRLGVTYFNTTVSQFQPNNDPLPLLTPASAGAILADVRARVPASLTAMGGALQRSIETLGSLPSNPTAPPRHVVLFTDGMQNVNPMVHELSSNPPQHDISNEPGRPSSGVTPTNLRLDMLSGIRVDTIGLGTGQAFLDLLEAIAVESGGLIPTGPGGIARSTSNAQDLRQFFVEELIDSLRGFSPQLIAYRRGALAGHVATETFSVNKGARKLLFKVSWTRGQKLGVRVLRQGIDVTSSARSVSGSFYRILAFDLLATGTPGALAGEWSLRIAGNERVAYEAAAIVEEPELRYWARLGDARNRADFPISLTVDVRADARPIDGPVTVEATIARPRIAVGNLLGDVTPFDRRAPELEPAMTLGERRLASLATDPRRWKQLAPRVDVVRLQANGKGQFSITLGDTAVPGLYGATVRIKGDDSRLGPFERSTTVTAIVRFGAADLAMSELTLRRVKEKDFEFALRPRDSHGNLLGPGLPQEIKLELSAGRIAVGPDDLGDGRYRFLLSLAEGEDPSIKLSVAQQMLFEGTFKELQGMTKTP